MNIGKHIKAIWNLYCGMRLQRVAEPVKKRAPYKRGERYDWCFACKQETPHKLMTKCGIKSGSEVAVVDICEMCCSLLDAGKRRFDLNHNGDWVFLDD